MMLGSCGLTRTLNSNHGYRVRKIESIGNFYVIYARKDGATFKIVSPKNDMEVYYGTKIRRGGTYNLVLRSKNDLLMEANPNFVPISLWKTCTYFGNGTYICTNPRRGIYDLYFSENLVGLYLLPFGDNTYKIKDIDCYNAVCFIDAQRNDSIFSIVSLIDSANPCFNPIEIGKRYSLDLIKIFPNEAFHVGLSEAERQNATTRLLFRDERIHSSLYVATNLNGLSFSDSPLSIEEIKSRFSYVKVMSTLREAERRRFLWGYSRRRSAPISLIGILYINLVDSPTNSTQKEQRESE